MKTFFRIVDFIVIFGAVVTAFSQFLMSFNLATIYYPTHFAIGCAFLCTGILIWNYENENH